MRRSLFQNPHPRPGRPGAIPALLGLLALLGLALLGGCLDSGPVLIGFSGPLTGRWADLGVQGRNGATLAVEDMNARGGLSGRQVELLVADEGETPEATVAAVRSLDVQGASVLVGLMTSAAAMAGLPVAEAAGLTVVSPTAMTPEFTGRRDAMFRVVPDLLAYARGLAAQAAGDGPGRALLVMDQGNAAFAEPYAQAFATRYTELGGSIAGWVRVSPGQVPDAAAVAKEIRSTNARDVLAVFSARTLANLAVGLQPAVPDIRLYTPMWGFSQEFLSAAGAAAEGVTSCVVVPTGDYSPQVAEFNARYLARFGYPSSFAAVLGYEAAMVAGQALERTGGSRSGLAAALLGLGRVAGVLGDIAFDASGDVARKVYGIGVRDGRVRTLGASDG